jgi:hypothetical protein
MTTKACALLLGFDLHHVDHIAPLAHFLSLPLIVTEPSMKECVEKYYPKMEILLKSPMEFASYILTEFDLVFTTLPRQLIDPLFFFDEECLRKKMYTFWVPHGNSDKDNLGALTKEKLLLIYGKQMEDSLNRHGVLKEVYKRVVIGAFRYHYFQLHHSFFKKVEFPKKQKTILYAPTWGSEALYKDTKTVLETLPKHYNLIVKLHPNSLHDPALKKLFVPKENILFLEVFPTIFPLLEQVDYYVGDHSSIAYDFLRYNRPLFFLSSKKTMIHLTGKTVPAKDLFKEIEKPDTYQEARKEIYEYAFDKTVDFTKLKEEITHTWRSFLEACSLD